MLPSCAVMRGTRSGRGWTGRPSARPRPNSTGATPLSRLSVPSTSSSSCAFCMSSRAGRRGRAAGRERREFRQQPGQPGRRGAEHPGEHVGRHGPGQRAERIDQRRQRQAFGPQFHALPGQHAEPLVGRPRAQLPGQPGLAHARLAADQRERRVPCLRAVKKPFQRPHLVLPPDEDQTDHVRAHK